MDEMNEMDGYMDGMDDMDGPGPERWGRGAVPRGENLWPVHARNPRGSSF